MWPFNKTKHKEQTKPCSIIEYFKQKEMQDAVRVEVTYKDGTKAAIIGPVATLWWRGAWISLRDTHNDDTLEIEKFRPVDKDGNIHLTLWEMIKEHEYTTGYCSFTGHMRKCSSTYNDIIKMGDEALPTIFAYLNTESCGMNIILLLADITKQSPYAATPIGGTVFASYNVKDCREAWLKWGKEHGYIK